MNKEHVCVCLNMHAQISKLAGKQIHAHRLHASSSTYLLPASKELTIQLWVGGTETCLQSWLSIFC